MADTIDRQAAIDAFKNELTVGESKGNYVTICSAIGYEGAKQILESLPSAEHRWIPVTERLPEKDGIYLVSGGGKVWIAQIFTFIYVRGWANDAGNPAVSAWMPLPEPYREEETHENR